MSAPLQIRQVAQYPLQTAANPGNVTLLQEGAPGTPYASILASDFVATALAAGGRLQINPSAGAIVFGAGDNAPLINLVSDEFLFSRPVRTSALNATFIDAPSVTVDGVAVATAADIAASRAASVTGFNFRVGDVQLEQGDILRAGGAPIANPHFTGWVLAPSHWDVRISDDTVATAHWVHDVLRSGCYSVSAFNGRTGCVTLSAADVNAAFAVAGPPFPSSQNPPLGDASSRIATTLFVDESLFDLRDRIIAEVAGSIDLSVYAPLNSPDFTGNPTAPTANAGTSTGQIATTAFVQAAVTASTTGVASFNTRTGAVVLDVADITGAGGAPLISPALSGTPTAPTASPGTSTGQLATTAFVEAAIGAIGSGVTSFNTRTGAVTLTTGDITGAGGAPLASPGFTGAPAAPTAAPGTSSTQLATTAFVASAIAALGAGVTSFNSRTGAVTLQNNDVSAAGGALVASPVFTGVPAAPTAAPGTGTTQIATCAFVQAAITAGAAGVASFNTRTGAVTLTLADVTGAGGAPVASPGLTGTPTAPTAAASSNDTTIATTAFVRAAVASAGGVASFNTRTGAVTLNSGDISAAGGAPIVSPSFTGVPLAPTAAPGTSSTQIATAAFVMAALAGTVTSFNSRNGAVTLIAGDITAAGGALLASPVFTGSPAAPTQAPGTSNTTLATTAFVQAAAAASGVSSFNTRTGAVTLTLADVTGAGGAPLASPVFTGVPAAPTAASSDSSTALATTAFVRAGVTSGSAAAAGTVGEVLTAQSSGLTLGVSGTWTAGLSLPLPAGDWDVTASLQFFPGSGNSITSWVCAITRASGAPATADSRSGIALTAGNLSNFYTCIGPEQFIGAAAMTAWIMIYAVYTGTSANPVSIIMRARRMR